MAKKGQGKKSESSKKEKKKKTESARYKLYDGKNRKNSFCPKCGPGIFLANHKDRKTCGSCGYMEKN